MRRIETKIDKNSPEFRENKSWYEEKLAEYKERVAKVREGGPPHMHEKHEKRGKLPLRKRLELLFDRNSPFLELSHLAAWGMHNNEAPSAGVVTGIGVIHGKEVMVVANDATVKGGTYFPETIRKHIRAQQIALENRLPCIYLVDSGGVFLPLQADVFPDKEHFGRIFYNQARLSALGIPQIATVLGLCTAGGAYMPAMSDEAVIVRKQGTIFIGGPPLVKAATGAIVDPEELGGADVHCRISGTADHYAQNDEDAIKITRNIVENIPKPKKFELDMSEPEEPFYDPSELLGVIPKDLKKPFDCREVIARIVDGSRFQEFKEHFGTTLITGFARIMGYPVGIVSNNGVLFSESACKGAHFVSMCAVRKIPLIFLQNITGFIIGKEYEHGGIARHGAKMVHAVSVADVPKLTIIIGGSYGAGNYAMCGRGYLPRFLWMWPTAKISVMGGEQAASVLLQVKLDHIRSKGEDMTPEEQAEFKRPILERYEDEGSAYFATARMWDDGIVSPLDTRTTLALALSTTLNSPIPDHNFGIFRM